MNLLSHNYFIIMIITLLYCTFALNINKKVRDKTLERGKSLGRGKGSMWWYVI